MSQNSSKKVKFSVTDHEFRPLDYDVLRDEGIDGLKGIQILVHNPIPANQFVVSYQLRDLEGIALLSLRWEELREQFFAFACERSHDSRWRDEQFRNHMWIKHLDRPEPITTRLYKLDSENLRTLIQYIREDLMAGINSRSFDVGDRLQGCPEE